MKYKISEIFVALVVFFLLATPTPAAERQTLRGHVPKVVAKLNLRPLGRLPATNRLYLLIGLPMRNPSGFSNQLAQLYNPISATYHHWLTPGQIAEQFGPTGEDYAAVIAWAKTNGLTIAATHADHTLLRVEGAVEDIEKMLHVKMLVYQHPSEDRTFFAPDVDPSLDPSVPIRHIDGLHNFSIPRSIGPKRTPHPLVPPDAAIHAGSGPTNSFWGNDFRSAYVPGTTLTGAGQSLGILIVDDFYANDIAAYISQSGITSSTMVVRIPIDGGVPGPGQYNDECSLDIEMSIAMAPGLANVLVYEMSTDYTKYVDVLKQMQEDNLAKQLSCSVIVEEEATDLNGNADVVYQQMAMQGQSFFQASGDTGCYYGPDYIGFLQWADDPYVTIVGGTTMTNLSAGGPWGGEVVWNDIVNSTGGGVSASYFGNYSIPSWQQGVATSLNGGSTTMRNVPDVAMVAHDLYIVLNNGSNTIVGGTSAASPLWAAFTALVNEQAVAGGQPTVGFLNPALYTLAQGPNYTNLFHDVTNGSTTYQPGGPGNPVILRLIAEPGYDLCTGLGTPNGTNLINALMPYTGAIWVDFNYTGSLQIGSYFAPFTTLTQGAAAVSTSGNIWIKTAGSSPETLKIQKAMTIRAANGPAKIGE